MPVIVVIVSGESTKIFMRRMTFCFCWVGIGQAMSLVKKSLICKIPRMIANAAIKMTTGRIYPMSRNAFNQAVMNKKYKTPEENTNVPTNSHSFLASCNPDQTYQEN